MQLVMALRIRSWVLPAPEHLSHWQSLPLADEDIFTSSVAGLRCWVRHPSRRGDRRHPSTSSWKLNARCVKLGDGVRVEWIGIRRWYPSSGDVLRPWHAGLVGDDRASGEVQAAGEYVISTEAIFCHGYLLPRGAGLA